MFDAIQIIRDLLGGGGVNNMSHKLFFASWNALYNVFWK